MPVTFRWGLQRSDLVRYNRVEGLSMGARGQVRPQTPLGPLSVTATGRLGVADLNPNVRVDVTRETLRRRRHLERLPRAGGRGRGRPPPGAGQLASRRSSSAGTTATTTGAAGPGSSGRPRPRSGAPCGCAAYAEYHQAAETETDFTLCAPGSSTLGRSATTSRRAEGWELGGRGHAGALVGNRPPLAPGGLELTLQGAGGDWSLRARLARGAHWRCPCRGRLPRGPGGRGRDELGRSAAAAALADGRRRHAPGLRAAGARGDVLRAGEGRGGPALRLRRRVPLLRRGLGGGPETRCAGTTPWYSAGVGLSLVDGLIRMDGAWGLRAPRDFRLELYLDGIL